MNECHIKVEAGRVIAFLPALCGKEDPGTLYYIAFDATNDEDVERMRKRAEMGRDSDTSLCPRCCSAFLANYNSDVRAIA